MWTGVLLGTVGRISTDTFPALWFILEINLIAFITLVAGRWTSKKTRIIYFIVQSIGTLVVLRGGVVSDSSSMLIHWVLLGLLLKASLAPLHFGGPAIISKMTSLTAAIFLTWQKIAPIFLIILCTPKAILHFVLLLNILVGSCCGIGAKNLFILLFFSGLLHVRWIMTNPISSAFTYFLLYMISALPIFLTHFSINLTVLIINMAGLPPLTGFFMKLNILQHIRLSYGILLLVMSTPLLYAYIRVFLYGNRHGGTLKASTAAVCGLGIIL